MELSANPNLQRDETALHRRKTDLIGQLIQISRESQTVQLSASQSEEDKAQVITYTQTGQGDKSTEYPEHTLTAADTSKASQAQPKA
jgi:hypothetical protein